jgi:hypothetical protein
VAGIKENESMEGYLTRISRGVRGEAEPKPGLKSTACPTCAPAPARPGVPQDIAKRRKAEQAAEAYELEHNVDSNLMPRRK